MDFMGISYDFIGSFFLTMFWLFSMGKIGQSKWIKWIKIGTSMILGIECDKKPYITNNMGMSWDLMGRFYGMYDQENVIVGLVGSENEGFTWIYVHFTRSLITSDWIFGAPHFQINPNITEISWPHFFPFNYSLAGIPHGWFCGSVLDPKPGGMDRRLNMIQLKSGLDCLDTRHPSQGKAGDGLSNFWATEKSPGFFGPIDHYYWPTIRIIRRIWGFLMPAMSFFHSNTSFPRWW